MKLIAYDLGASNGRCMLATYEKGRISMEVISRFENQITKLGNEYCWDVDRLHKNILSQMEKCSNHEIASLGIDAWGVDFVLLDKSGKRLMQPFCYRSPHTEGMMEQAFSIIPKKEIYARTGIQFMRINTLYHLMAIAKDTPEVLIRAETFLHLTDYFIYLLTGNKQCEYTMASTTQMLNVDRRTWDMDLINKMGIKQEMFLPITMPGRSANTLSRDLQMKTGMKAPIISIAGHDTASAVIAIPTEGKDFAYLSCGTWSLLGVESDEPIINDLTYECNFTNEGGYDGKIRLLKNIMGLWLLQLYKAECEECGIEIDYSRMVHEADNARTNNSYIDPDNTVFLEPGPISGRINEILVKTGQKPIHERGEMIRCILESLALKYKYVYEQLKKATGRNLDTIHMIGGGIKNRLLCQLTANATNTRVLAGPVEATAIGNVLVQLIHLNRIFDIAEGRSIVRASTEITEYIPHNKTLWQEKYEEFLRKTGLKEQYFTFKER